MNVAIAAPRTSMTGRPNFPYINSQSRKVFKKVAQTEITRGGFTSPISRSAEARTAEIVAGIPENPIINIYCVPTERIAPASELFLTMRERI